MSAQTEGNNTHHNQASAMAGNGANLLHQGRPH